MWSNLSFGLFIILFSSHWFVENQGLGVIHVKCLEGSNRQQDKHAIRIRLLQSLRGSQQLC